MAISKTQIGEWNKVAGFHAGSVRTGGGWLDARRLFRNFFGDDMLATTFYTLIDERASVLQCCFELKQLRLLEWS